MERAMNILYEDKDIIVCEKPVGVASQTERGFGEDMVSLLMKHLKNNGEKQAYVGVIHRLDKMVGGVMVYAKTKQAAAELSRQVANHEVSKKYFAVCCGEAMEQKGTMVDYLVRDAKTNTSKIAAPTDKNAKRAELSYEILGSKRITADNGSEVLLSLADVTLLTGRHHQIRVQFSSRNMPLFQDVKYNKQNILFTKMKAIGLYSYQLAFLHPKTKKPLEFQCSSEQGVFSLFKEEMLTRICVKSPLL